MYSVPRICSVVVSTLLGLGAIAGCGGDPISPPGQDGGADLATPAGDLSDDLIGDVIDLPPGPGDMAGPSGDQGPPPPDLMPPPPDLTQFPDLTIGGAVKFGPGQPNPFSVKRDPMPDPSQGDKNVEKDPNGFLGIYATKANFDFLWLAGDEDWNIGTVSKIDSKKVKEVARYFSVTCLSNNPGGSRVPCDGTNGCCTADDNVRYTNRLNGKPPGPHQAVQTNTNRPSRTATDWSGDVWVANRAFVGQSSVTKIANDISDCIDRNGTKGVQTSSDVNGDGVIDTDCNRDNLPDDIANVKAKACVNGKAQEFYGLDDECVLFTTSTNTNLQAGRPLALGKGREDGTPSDAWAGTYNDGKFFRVDGSNGTLVATAQLPMGARPYGAVIDAKGILWATNLGGGLYYFDTANPASAGTVRTSVGFALGGYGIALDRDQNVWTAGYPEVAVFRYSPDRAKDFAQLGKGYWTRVGNIGVAGGATGNPRGLGLDSRTDKTYFGWVARDGGYIVRFEASSILPPQGIDKSVDGTNYPVIKVAGSGTIGGGVDSDQNVWGISRTPSVATRIKVDAAGTPAKPDIVGGVDNMGCPIGAGDRCTLGLTGTMSNPQPYTYSDFTGFGLRNFTLPKGSWDYIQKSACPQGKSTVWSRVVWQGDTPPSTKITLRTRAGQNPVPDNTWGMYTGEYLASPAELSMKPGPLAPNPAPYIQVEFTFSTTDQTLTPKLKNFEIQYTCQ